MKEIKDSEKEAEERAYYKNQHEYIEMAKECLEDEKDSGGDRNRFKFINPETFYSGLYLEKKSANQICEQYGVLFSEIYSLLIGCIGVFKDSEFEVIKIGILDLIDDLKLQVINYKNLE